MSIYVLRNLNATCLSFFDVTRILFQVLCQNILFSLMVDSKHQAINHPVQMKSIHQIQKNRDMKVDLGPARPP